MKNIDFKCNNDFNIKSNFVCNFAFFGHVDSGKSSTIGRLLVDTNTVQVKSVYIYFFKFKKN